MIAGHSKTLFALLAAFSIFLAAGCGGGGSGNPGGGGGGPISETQRASVMDAISAKITSLPPDTLIDPQKTAQAMLDFLKSRPEIVQSGVSENQDIWGVFSDNQPFVVINNEHRPADRSARLLPPASQTTRAWAIPSGQNARLMHMFGNVDILTSDPRNTLADILTRTGYSATQEVGRLSDFRNPVETAVLYTGGHGGVGGWLLGGVANTKHYCLWTNEVAKAPNDKEVTYPDPQTARDRIEPTPLNPRIVLLNADISSYRWQLSWPPVGIATIGEWHWGITSEFVKSYMNFSPNSFWYDGACSGYDTELRDAAFSKKLSAYAGWDNEVNRFSSSNAAMYLFDRMAGSNVSVNNNALQLPLEAEPQRAFQWQSVFADMQSKGLTTSTQGAITAQLHIDNNPADTATTFGLFAPSIEHMTVDATADNELTLTLFGLFGSTQGTVKLDGSDVAVKSWKDSEIEVLLPPGDDPHAAGDVVVEVDGHKSNPVQLTMWTITVHAEDKADFSGTVIIDPTGAVGGKELDGDQSGSTTTSADLVIYVRGDAHDYHNGAGQTPLVKPQGNFTVTRNARKTKNARVTSWDASGTVTRQVHPKDGPVYDTWTDTLSATGAPPILFDGSDPRGTVNSASGQLDLPSLRLSVYPFLSVSGITKNRHVTTFMPSSSESVGGGMTFSPNNGPSGPVPLNIHLDAGFGVEGGSMSESYSDTGAGISGTRTLRWSGTVSHPPDTNAARSAQRTSEAGMR